MKKIILFLLLLICRQWLTAQPIGIGTTSPHPSAQLDVSSTTKGMLVPRMGSAERTAITTPARGLLVFDNTTNTFWFYNGTAWTELTAGGGNTGWTLTGNSGAADGTSFIGTTTDVPVSFRQNNIGIGRLDAGKNNVFLGDLTGGGTETANNTMIIGHYTGALNNTGTNNIFVGKEAGLNNTTATGNTFIGKFAGKLNTTGAGNTVKGSNSFYYNTTGRHRKNETWPGFY